MCLGGNHSINILGAQFLALYKDNTVFPQEEAM